MHGMIEFSSTASLHYILPVNNEKNLQKNLENQLEYIILRDWLTFMLIFVSIAPFGFKSHA